MKEVCMWVGRAEEGFIKIQSKSYNTEEIRQRGGKTTATRIKANKENKSTNNNKVSGGDRNDQRYKNRQR